MPHEVSNHQMHWVRSGQARLACESMGNGPRLIFLHAGVADRRSWLETQRCLAAHFRSTAYDRRGFGDTEYTAEAHSHVADLLAVHNVLEVGPCILVGNSQGGSLAIDFALKFPHRVRALVLVAPAYSGMPEPRKIEPGAARLLAKIQVAKEAEDLVLVNELEQHFWLDGPESEAGRVEGQARDLFLEMNAGALGAEPCGDALEPASAKERLGLLGMPVHLILGGRDLAHIIEQGHWIASQVPMGSVTLFDDAAHLPQLEDVRAFSKELERFLGQLQAQLDSSPS